MADAAPPPGRPSHNVLEGGGRPARPRGSMTVLTEVLSGSWREVRDVFRAATTTHRRLRNVFVTVVIATIGVDLLCAVLAYFLERHSPETDVKTLGSAAFWTTTQLLTVSSSVKNPISAGGRVLDVFMEIYAITVIATLAGGVGSFLQKRGAEMDEKGRAAAGSAGSHLMPPGR